jgi:hypothetical protein
MEFVAVVGFVASLLQLSKTCWTFMAKVKQIYRSEAVSLSEASLNELAAKVKSALLKIEHNVTAADDDILTDLYKEMRGYTEEILGKLEKASPLGGRSLRRSLRLPGAFSKALKEMYSQKDVENLHNKIQDTFDRLQTRFVVIRYEKAWILVFNNALC